MAKYQTNIPPDFVFGAVETDAPYLSAPYKASDSMVAAGWKEIQKLLPIYKKCLVSNSWPAYSTGLVELELPYWANKKEGE